ncbi:hypothetical protein YC2023_073758 [Brassica napus]
MTLREGGMDDIHHALKKKTVTKVKAENELMLSRFDQVIISNNQLIFERETEQRVPMAEDGVDGIDEEDWHTFALSETPLTMPLTQPQTKAIPHEVPDYSVTKAGRSKERLPTIPHSPGGIVITERGDPTRATRRQTGPSDREKNKRPVEEDT